MPNPAFPLPPLSPEKALLRILGSGPSFPFSFSATGNVRSVQVTDGLTKVNQAIHAVLSTRTGERMFLPEFGCFSGDTTVLLVSGREVPISSLVGASAAMTFGVLSKPGTHTQPPSQDLVPTRTKGAVSRGEKPTVIVALSNGQSVRCTPDHQFLAAIDHRTYIAAQDLEAGTRLAWLDRGTYDLSSRIAAWKQMQRTVTLRTMPMSAGIMQAVSVVEAEPTEVFDLLDSETENYTLGVGAVVHNSNLPRLVFEPNGPVLADKLKFWTADALARWVPRISVDRIDLIDFSLMGPSDAQRFGVPAAVLTAAQDGTLIGIYIQYTINRTYVQGSYVYPFVLGGMPMADTVTGNRYFQGQLP